ENILNERSEDIIPSLLKLRNKEGYFVDKNFDPEDSSVYHKPDYVINQFTYFTLVALDILGFHFENLEFLSPFYNEIFLYEWFESLNWGKFWYESNKIMFLLYFLTYAKHYSKSQNNTSHVLKLIYLSFNILDGK